MSNCKHDEATQYADYCPKCVELENQRKYDEVMRGKKVAELKRLFECEHGVGSNGCDCFAYYIFTNLDATNGEKK